MFLSKYGVARHIYIPVIKRTAVDFAVGADWTPVAGDVKISKDGGAAANVTNLPSAIAMGNGAIWDFSLTATEMQAAQVVVTVADSATKAVEDQSFIIETYGNASGQHPFDLATATQSVSVTQFGGVAGTFASGRPEVNTTHAAGTAWGSGAITAASIATDAIDSDAIAASAVTEIQSGLALATDLATVAGYIDTEVAAIKAKTDQLVFTTVNRVDSTALALGTTAKSEVNTEVLDVLNVDTFAEPGQGAPAATTTLVAKIGYLFKAFRNKVTQDGSTYKLYADDASTVDQKASVSDDATTFTRGEVASGP